MSPNTPTQYLDKVTRLLTGTRALGSAMSSRSGYLPYSVELDFRTTDISAAQAVVEWAKEQAPYAEIRLVNPVAAAGNVTVFAHIELAALARYLAGQSFLHTIGQTWETASGAVPDLVRKAIDQTVGAGSDWQSLLDALGLEKNRLGVLTQTLAADALAGPLAAIVQEAARDTVAPTAQWMAFQDALRSRKHILDAVIQTFDSGEYLLPARSATIGRRAKGQTP
jgi:hypothetical protein